MPMHDWTKVTPNSYHHFHGRWMYAIADALNDGILPAEYYAASDQKTPPISPDVITLKLDDPSPSNGSTNGWHGHRNPQGGVATLERTKPRVRHELSWEPIEEEQTQRRLVVRHNSDHRIVAVIEIISPSNKSTVREFRDFIGKACGLLSSGIHVMIVDPFPASKRDPNGMPEAVWKWLVNERAPEMEFDSRTLSSYVGSIPFKAYIEPFHIGDKLKKMPLFLTSSKYVTVPLEEAYQVAWKAFPAPMKAALSKS